MGSCVSHHKVPESAVELRLSVGSKNEKLLFTSTLKPKPDTVNGGDHSVASLAVKSQRSPRRFRDGDSKEEAFFDSQPWLESDCEDDFLSVNGDLTPSRGSTPVHDKFSSGNPPVNKAPIMDETPGSVPEPSPPDTKKRLSELFKESLRHQEGGDEENEASDNSVALENVITPNRVLRASEKSAQCCLPRLRSSRSFSERKKKMSSPSGSS